MTVRVVVNNSAFRAMAVGAELRAAVTAEAGRAAVIAEGLSQDFAVTHEYEESFVVDGTGSTRLKTAFGEHDVAVGKLTNESPHAAAVEWGNENDHKAHHVLTRTLDSLA